MTPALTTEVAPRPAPPVARSAPAVLVLLAGGVKPSPLRDATGRDPLDLPVAPHRTLLDEWRSHAAGLGLSADTVRVALDASHAAPNHRDCRLVRDASEYRGAGGALRDAVTDLPDDALVLAAPASQLLLAPLGELADELSAADADAALLCNADGTPGMLLLARAGLLKLITAVGFVDLKEQALPLLAGRGRVRAVRSRTPRVVCVRTPAEFLRALRLAGGADARRGSGFALAESGADLGPGATLHDSVVLSSARVGAGAVVVRSLVGPGAVVAAGEVVVDRVVTAPRKEQRR